MDCLIGFEMLLQSAAAVTQTSRLGWHRNTSKHQDLHTSIRTPSAQATTWKESDNNKSNVQNTAVNMIFFTVALNV